MPFQSEKQRRFLHANHPEIAKRWEREYATGGISNHFRKKIADGGQLVKPGPGRPGYGGKWGPGGEYSASAAGAASFGRAPSPASVVNTAAMEDVNIGVTHPALRGTTGLGEGGRRTGPVTTRGASPFKYTGISPVYKNWWDATKDKKKEKVNWVEKNWEDLKALSTVPFNFTKALFGNVKDPDALTTATLTDAMREDLISKAKAKGTLTGNIDYTDYNTPTKTFTGLNKYMDPIDIANALTIGGTNFTTDELGNIDFTGDKYDFGDENVVGQFIDEGGLMGASKKLGEKIYDWTHEAAKGGIARKNYYHGGILDIDASEEIISDDGNDIELTAYNAAFDEPTGVKSLFQAKDGGTPQLAKKSKDGKRPGYGGPHKTEAAGKSYSGGNQGSDKGHSRFEPGSGYYGEPVTTKTTTTTGDGHQDRILSMVDKTKIPGTEEYMIEEKTDYVEIPKHKSKLGPLGNRPKMTVTLKQAKKFAEMDAYVDEILDIFSTTGAIYAGTKWIGNTMQDLIPFIGKLMPEYFPKVNFHGEVIEDQVTGSDLGFFQGDEWDYLWGKGPDDTKHDPVPIYDPVTGAVSEEYAQGDYYMSAWDRIKANQAKRAMLVEKGIIQDNPVVDESVTDITMQANSGGLANLFRVKNQ